MLNEKSLAGVAQTMSSLQIAEITGRPHSNVMRDIRNLLEQLDNQSQFSFELSYRDQKQPNGGIKRIPHYLMTKNDCLLLASGYDANLRAKIILRWEELEKEKQSGGFAVPTSFAEALQLAADQARQIEKLETANWQQERTIAKLKPKADFADTAFNADTLVTMSQAAKILKLDFGRNTLFKKLREHGILFRHSNEPAQKYVNAGYFTVVEGAPIQRSDGRMFIPITTYCTQKGLAFLHKLFGGDGFALKLL